MKFGVEIEFWTVDNNGELTDCRELVEELEFAEEEFVQPLYEIKTSPGRPEEVLDQLKHRMKTSVEAARKKDLKIVPLGTPLNSGEINTVESKRAEIQEKIIGKNLRHAKRVAGTHIHIEKGDVSSQINRFTALDPALALQNSSPIYQGKPVASSSRNEVYRNRCYRNYPEHGKLWNYTGSEEEWRKRLEKRFQEFIQAGKNEGISEEDIKQHFSEADALWTPVRLRENFPTVEYRSLDVTVFSEFKRFFTEFTSIFHELEDDDLPDMENLRNLSSQAIKNGLTPKVSDYLEELGFTPSKYNTASSNIGHSKTSRKEARKIRLKYADKLEKELS